MSVLYTLQLLTTEIISTIRLERLPPEESVAGNEHTPTMEEEQAGAAEPTISGSLENGGAGIPRDETALDQPSVTAEETPPRRKSPSPIDTGDLGPLPLRLRLAVPHRGRLPNPTLAAGKSRDLEAPAAASSASPVAFSSPPMVNKRAEDLPSLYLHRHGAASSTPRSLASSVPPSPRSPVLGLSRSDSTEWLAEWCPDFFMPYPFSLLLCMFMAPSPSVASVTPAGNPTSNRGLHRRCKQPRGKPKRPTLESPPTTHTASPDTPMCSRGTQWSQGSQLPRQGSDEPAPT